MPPRGRAAPKRAKKNAVNNNSEEDDQEAEYNLKIQLIELVQGYPEIYDIQDPRHHKQYLRNAAWEAIAEALYIK